jgi:hypothetical protein
MHDSCNFYAVPPPVVSIPDPLTTPYNGTVFTLTGMVTFNHQSSVDTPVTISAIWTGGSGLAEATSQTDNYSLTFQPIATNSSETFTLIVTVQSSDNSAFIVGSSGNDSYNLIVRCKLGTIDDHGIFSSIIIYSAFYSSSVTTSEYLHCISSRSG